MERSFAGTGLVMFLVLLLDHLPKDNQSQGELDLGPVGGVQPVAVPIPDRLQNAEVVVGEHPVEVETPVRLVGAADVVEECVLGGQAMGAD
jgi:hypothetical protein